MRVILAALGLALFCAQVSAEQLDLSFNSDAVRLQYVHEFKSNNLNLDTGWLYNSDSGSVIHVGLNLAGFASSGSNPITAGVGARIVYTNGEKSNQDGFMAPVGGFLRWSPSGLDRLSVSGDIYYAPKILSLGDAEKYEEYAIRVGYNITREADIYIGARYINGEYKQAPRALYDNGMHVGISLRF
jgi:hypothetical protein